MCQYSIHGATRDAKEGETLYAAIDHNGAFVDTQGYRRVASFNSWAAVAVCIKYGQTCTLEKLQLTRAMGKPFSDKIGETHVVTLQRKVTKGKQGNGDTFVFADGTWLPSCYVDTPIYVGVKLKVFHGRKQFDSHVALFKPITGKAGMKKVRAAIREAIATTPDEKPARRGVRRSTVA